MISRHKIRAAFKILLRNKNPIIFGDPTRLEPISRVFGEDRGTPIDRYYIEHFLGDNKRFIYGNVLEVAEPLYTKKFGDNVDRSCVITANTQHKARHGLCDSLYVADLTRQETLPDEQFDCFICTQTLNFIYDVVSALKGTRMLLKPDGIFLGTVASYGQISRDDADRWGDYWRFSEASIRKLIASVYDSEPYVKQYGNALAAQAFLQGVSVEDMPHSGLLDVEDADYPITIGFIIRNT